MLIKKILNVTESIVQQANFINLGLHLQVGRKENHRCNSYSITAKVNKKTNIFKEDSSVIQKRHTKNTTLSIKY